VARRGRGRALRLLRAAGASREVSAAAIRSRWRWRARYGWMNMGLLRWGPGRAGPGGHRPACAVGPACGRDRMTPLRGSWWRGQMTHARPPRVRVGSG